MVVFADIADFKEDERIDIIGKSIMNGKRTSADKPLMIAFVVEDDAKADRYIKKLNDRFPEVRIIDRLKDTPCKGMISVRVGEPLR